MGVLDIRGKEILSGSKIVYPGREGSSLWLSTGEVVRDPVPGYPLAVRNENGREVKIRHIDRVAVVD